jgi:LCP family protein required for cell wall assembly
MEELMKKKEPKKYTREEIKMMREKNKKINLFTGVIVGMFICVTVYFILNLLKLSGIEDVIRYIVITLLVILSLYVLRKYLKLRKQPKKIKYIIFIILLLLLGTGEFVLGSIIDKGISTIDKISKDKITYTSALIAMKDGNYTEISKIKDASVGIITDTDDVEGYKLAQSIIKKDKISDDQLVEYDDYITMLTDLYDGEVDAIFISGSYADKYSSIEKFTNISDEVVVLDKYSKLMKKVVDSSTKASTKKVTEPFTLLLLGVDSETEDISKTSGLGDSIMLITFNPNTLNATIFSIPRDTYVPISCYRNALSKITHAASGGDSCMIKTIENFTGIDIDYYVKMNFKGLVKLVDSLGGIDVEVPYKFCESNSSRSLSDLVFVNEGWQHLDGEQALALSRNRKEVSECGSEWNKGTRNDFVRGQNQQLVVKAIINKAKTIKSVNQVYEILDTISISLDTNLTTDQMLDFYNVFKKILLSSNSLSDTNDVISMQKTYLNGSGGLIYDNIMNMDLYEYVPSTQSLNAIIKAMKINLGLIEDEPNKTFSFSADEEYEQEVIGKNLTGGITQYSAKGDTTSQESSCGDNEELGADKVTCVCKNGYTKNSSGVCTKDEEKTCGTNEELGADKVTCVCKNGYTKNSSGVCTKNEEKTCGTNEELGADKVTCVCKNGYTKNSSGVCEKKETESDNISSSDNSENTPNEENTDSTVTD